MKGFPFGELSASRCVGSPPLTTTRALSSGRLRRWSLESRAANPPPQLATQRESPTLATRIERERPSNTTTRAVDPLVSSSCNTDRFAVGVFFQSLMWRYSAVLVQLKGAGCIHQETKVIFFSDGMNASNTHTSTLQLLLVTMTFVPVTEVLASVGRGQAQLCTQMRTRQDYKTSETGQSATAANANGRNTNPGTDA